MNVKTVIIASAMALAGFASTAHAQEINRTVANPNALFASVVAVPPGYTLSFRFGRVAHACGACCQRPARQLGRIRGRSRFTSRC